MLTIRRIEDSDHNAVWNLHNLALHHVGAHIGAGPWDNDFRDISGVYLNAGGEFLVGLYEGRIVAMGALRRISDDRAEIKRMRVHPDFQGRGFGQALLEALESRALELGYTELHLDTTIKQVAAQELYMKNGFKEFGCGMVAGLEVIYYRKRIEKSTPDDVTVEG